MSREDEMKQAEMREMQRKKDLVVEVFADLTKTFAETFEEAGKAASTETFDIIIERLRRKVAEINKKLSRTANPH